jgi:serine/threonine protein kinase
MRSTNVGDPLLTRCFPFPSVSVSVFLSPLPVLFTPRSDMKLENILLDAEGHIRLTDFGLCDRLTVARPRSNSRSGSKVYIAPEVLSDQPHDQAVDWWGFGVLLHLLATMQAPFWSEDVSEVSLLCGRNMYICV